MVDGSDEARKEKMVQLILKNGSVHLTHTALNLFKGIA